MPTKEPNLTEAFQDLKQAAAEINAASDQLAAPIAALDALLKKLNIGVGAWVTIQETTDENHVSRGHAIGYARVDSRWGIALRTWVWDEQFQHEVEPTETWFFSDGPRWLRVEGLQALPQLVVKLSERAREVAEKVRAGTAYVENLVVELGSVVLESSKSESGQSAAINKRIAAKADSVAAAAAAKIPRR